MSIKAVLWDFGGVILSSPFEAFARYEADHGLPADFIRTVNATNPDTNAWARLERNEVTLPDFIRAFEEEALALGHAVDGAAVLSLLAGEVRPAMVEALRRCHQHHKTALLTNNVVGMGDARHISEVLEHFDVVLESSKLGVRKPDPRFYLLACEELGIEPHEAVFLDDLGVNLKPARALGMTTIKVVDPDEALDALETVLGLALR